MLTIILIGVLVQPRGHSTGWTHNRQDERTLRHSQRRVRTGNRAVPSRPILHSTELPYSTACSTQHSNGVRRNEQ